MDALVLVAVFAAGVAVGFIYLALALAWSVR